MIPKIDNLSGQFFNQQLISKSSLGAYSQMPRRRFSFPGLVISSLVFAANVSLSQTLLKNFPSTDGFVSAIVSSGDTVFIGGTFSYVGPSTGNCVALDATTGGVNSNFPALTGFYYEGEVYAVVPDGSGGWYVGGAFTYVAGTTRKYFAHINSDMNVDMNWTIYPDGPVYAILVSGSTIYLGGGFKNIILSTSTHSQRWRLAALDATRDTLLSWNPKANDAVRTLALSGSTIYAGGNFTLLNLNTDTVARNYIAAIDTATGVATSWAPNPNGIVNSIVVSGSTVYAGGYFTAIGVGDSVRNYIAALDSSTGVATDWNPNANNYVMTLAASDSLIYAAGTFGAIGGSTRMRIASLDTSTGTATSWDPNANAIVNSIVISGSTVYAGGKFTNVGGQTRNHLAALDATTGAATSWNPDNPDNTDTVLVVGVSGSTVLAGGIFITVGPVVRNNIAAFDATTGAILNWDPNIDGGVFSMVLSGSTLYVGGSFGKIGTTGRSNAGAIDIPTATATSWNPNVNGQVNTMALAGSKIFLGGHFTTVSGSTNTRDYIAAVSASTGTVQSWAANANNDVMQLTVAGSTVYAGGFFTTIKGQTRNHLAAISVDGSTLSSWDPDVNNEVDAVTVSGPTLYIGGLFSTVGGVSRKYIAAVDTSTGLVTNFDPSANNVVDALAPSGSLIYAGGEYSSIGGASRNCIAALDTATGLATSWNPNADAAIQTITLDRANQQIYLGGSFAVIKGGGNQTFAVLTNPADTVLPVELVSFSAVATGLSAKLEWTTATEINCNGFEIQRSALSGQPSGGHWSDVAFVRGAGSSSSPRTYSFIDRNLSAGRYGYRIKQLDNNGQTKLTNTIMVDVGQAPRVFTLSQNYPNPFNPTTTIDFTLEKDGHVSLKVYDILGREVATLLDENRKAGEYQQVVFNGSRYSSGVYFATLQSGGKVLLKKMLLVK
jgi:trimeric autotransporter adhesin